MTSRYVFFLILLFLFFSPTLTSALNPFHSNNTHILKDVLKIIALKQKWDVEGVNLSKLEVSKARLGVGRKYEFRVRFGKTHLLFKFPDEVHSWKNVGNEAGSDFVDLVSEFSSKAVLDSFKLEGPFDLRLSGSDEASLALPFKTSRKGLKRILVGEGITVEVSGAQEVSLFQAFNGALQPIKERRTLFPFGQSRCLPLIPIHLLGSVSLVAYHARNPGALIATVLSSEGIELLPEKCYSTWINWQQASPISSLNAKIVKLEKALGSILGNKIHQNGSVVGSVNVRGRASNITRFQLALERDIGRNESRRTTLAEWQTRPSVEQVWFEVTARVEEQRLQPLLIKKVRPFSLVESSLWSSLMSNISFTKFPSILVPPEALTLDVKW